MMVGVSDGSVWRSVDMGYNWTRIPTPLSDMGIMANIVAMKNGQAFMVAGDFTFSFTDTFTVNFATQDGGQSWVSGMSGLTVAATHFLPGSRGTFLMAGHNDFGFGREGTAVSYDFGETWELIDTTSIIAMDFLDDSTGYGACCNNFWPTANGQISIWNGDSLWTSCNLYPNPIQVGASRLLIGDTDFSLQWLDCDQDFAPIPGENRFFFQPDSAGSYSLQVSSGRCVDTLDCVSFNLTEIGSLAAASFELYPNPARNALTLKLPEGLYGQALGILILDAQGRKMQQINESFVTDEIEIDQKGCIQEFTW